MTLKPKAIARATPEEIENLRGGNGRVYKWEFPEESFDGNWWRLEFANKDDQSSGLNSWRSQATSTYKKRSQCYRKGDTVVFVRLTKLDTTPGKGKPRRISKAELGESNGENT
jgi:hypothetical protein